MSGRKMKTMYDTQGQALRKLRTDRSLYQETVGDAVGVSKSAVSEWERGVSAPGRETLAKLDRYFGNQGDVFKIYGYAPTEPTNSQLLEALEDLRALAEYTNLVLHALAENRRIALPTPPVEVEGRRVVLAGRRKDDRP